MAVLEIREVLRRLDVLEEDNKLLKAKLNELIEKHNGHEHKFSYFDERQYHDSWTNRPEEGFKVL